MSTRPNGRSYFEPPADSDKVSNGTIQRVHITNDSSFPIPVVSNPAGTPAIYNFSATAANTEYSQALTDGTSKFLIRVRGNAQLQLAFTSGASGITFITIPPGASYAVDSLSLSSFTLYFQVNKASQVVEILEWS